MKIGFIGLGNMAKAIVGGLLEEGFSPSEIIGSAATDETLEAAKELFLRDGETIETTRSNTEVAEKAQVLFLAVKPQFLSQVIGEIKGCVSESCLIISIAAGKTISFLESEFGRKLHIVRCMPNTPALVSEGCTGVCYNGFVTEDEKTTAKKLLSSFGLAIEVPERLMDTVGAVSGSSPAFVFMFIEAMADGAVKEGMPRKLAYDFAAQAVLGSAKLVLESGKHPGELKDMVCSPGGTTIEGVAALEESGFRSGVMKAITACVEKSKKL